ncbi:MAG TPA: transcription elongation factor GreA [Thermoleophilaceae bacterium]|nr:transcription elongation factor GreA [Thermoleophilaceae bacterium]
MSETHKLTAEAAERLETEVTRLEGEGRREIAERIGIAREWGDLKENAEYHAAKEEAAMLEAKIARMRDQLRTSEIVEAAADGDGAGMYSAVTYADSKAGKEMTFTLVPATEADPSQKRISIDSPVGQALAGASEGDKRTLETPGGERAITIVKVEQS